MPRISIERWRTLWRAYINEPDGRDHERERTFLRDHANYGARIHQTTADLLADAVRGTQETAQRHTLFLKLFAEYVNALESLGAWGWTLQHRLEFRLFLDGFLSYPHSGPDSFYESALAHDGDLVALLALPERQRVIRAYRQRLPETTAREVGEFLDVGLANIKEAADQYFVSDAVLLTHYNKAKHGVTMLRLDAHTQDELDFQIIAPQRDVDTIAAGAWYDVAKFRASDEMADRVQRNTRAVTGSIQQLSSLAWVLYEAGLLYERVVSNEDGDAQT